MNAQQEFRDAIATAGLTPPDEIIGDGKIQRFSSNGNPRDKAGWYVFHDDERPAGRFGCNRSQIDATWSSKNKREFTPEEKQAWRKKMDDAKAQREAEAVRERAECATRSAQMWEQAQEISHPYGVRKQVGTEGSRVLNGELLIPLRHGPGAIVGLQRIAEDGEKKFLKGTPITGAYTVLGKPSKLGPVVICEGWATGMSIRAATGYCVVVAFNAGNIKPVAKKIRAALPEAEIIIAADDDAFTVRPASHPQAGEAWNPGVLAAVEAATEIRAKIATPRWEDERGKGTDFNDLHISESLESVKTRINSAIFVAAPDNQPKVNAASDLPPTGPAAVEKANNPASSGAVFSQAVAAAPTESLPAPASQMVDYYGWLPNTNDKGKPLATIENLNEVLRRLNVIVRYNVISKEEEILIPTVGFSMDNRQNASLSWLISECAKFKMPVDRVPDFVTYLADQNQYNPVAQWITSSPWDGQDHLSQLIATVKAKNEAKDPRVTAMKTAFMTRWLISAVAAAFRPNGVSAHGVLVFQGAQYIGKTKWFKTLVPDTLGVLKDGMLLRPDDRDSVMKCVSNWLVELGEIDATFRKSDVAALKSFLTSDRDVLRRAYARKESAYARRTVFFASVNPKNYLHDETGNRRYWTIECESLDHDHGVDMQQCWAQIYEQLYLPGESWFLTPDELDALNTHNEEFTVIDPIEDLITNSLDWKTSASEWRWMTPTEALMAVGKQNPTKADVTKAGMIIRKLNGNLHNRKGTARLLSIPPIKVSRVT
jgi:putative DNA primase/helicase